MRDRLLRGLTALGVLAAALAGAARAQAPGLSVQLEGPDELALGDRAEIVARVRLEPPNDLPLLVTPSGEGPAVEVVRGRLLRADADDPAAETLRFRIPIVARSAGTSVIRVRALGWACAERCRQASGEASATLRVARR